MTATFAVIGTRWANLNLPIKFCRKCEQPKPSGKFDKGRRVCRQCRHSGARRDRAIARQAAFRQQSPDVVKQRNGAYYAANAEDIKANYRSNPHLRWASEYRRRIKRLGVPIGLVHQFTKQDVVSLYGDACHYCSGGPFEELDHVVPVCRSGDHVLTNVRPSCGKCNRSKGIKDVTL